MLDFNERNATEAVLARMDRCDNPRLKEVMGCIVRHLHDAVREIEPTPQEWMSAIEFLTQTGQWCNDKRQEYILLSDTLGVSMLVDAINNRKPPNATESTVLGPFHVDGAPVLEHGANISKEDRGEPCLVSGRVLDLQGRPVAGALVDVWQARDDGFYDVQLGDDTDLRGVLETDRNGQFTFRTIMPLHYPIPTDGPVGKLLDALGRHPYRPAHIHFMIKAKGFVPLTTHLFVAGGDYLDSDAVFGVKQSLIKTFTKHDTPAADVGINRPYYSVEHDFTLVTAEENTV